MSGDGVRVYRFQAAHLRALAQGLELEGAASDRLAAVREHRRMAHELHMSAFLPDDRTPA
jgi:hypothetical protein